MRSPSRLASMSADRRICATRATWRFATLDMSKNGWLCTILIGARVLGHIRSSGSGSVLLSRVLKLDLTALNELKSLLSGRMRSVTRMRR